MRIRHLSRSALLLALTFPALVAAAKAAPAPAHPYDVTITRDTWGIAHVKGRTDADAVFGAIYAQAEDDFPRIEANLLTALGRMAEAKGEDAVWQDLRQRLWIDPEALKRDYAACSPWLRKLMDAWAAGLNHYLATHPQEKPQVIVRFEPWMALSFTEGSIGGDIESVGLGPLARFHKGEASARALALAARIDDEPRGSNGIAIAPKLSANRHALLLINPHTSLFFRSELGMESREGLHAYGASTWGQFFIYQGFNARLGWMHTSSGADNIDEYAETVEQRDGRWFYRHAGGWKPVEERTVTLQVRQPDGSMSSRSFTTYATRHGPVVRSEGERWIAVALMHRPVEALSQSWLRTKARNRTEYLKALEYNANSSNNTLYADADGNIALMMPEFAPRRDQRFDYREPVDGTDPATDWQGLYGRDEAPNLDNPATGWVYNANDAPWRAAGEGTFDPSRFAATFDSVGANPRGDHALDLLGRARGLTLETLHALAYDPHMPLFEDLVPALPEAVDPQDPLSGPVKLLKTWDRRWSAGSEAMSLAHYWADELDRRARSVMRPHDNVFAEIRRTPPAELVAALARAVDRITKDFGGWKVPWGEVNRYQRTTADIVQPFADSLPSLPVAFASARFGSLASYGAKQFSGSKRWYGTSGNSFVAVVEFGPKVRALAVSSGGASGRADSVHFSDQAALYAGGGLREIWFYDRDVQRHRERRYRP